MLLFVYGTLLPGERNHGLLLRAGAERLGPAATRAEFALWDLGPYPALLPGGGVVQGELWAVGSDELPAIDALEDHPHLYERTGVLLADGRAAETYVYRRPLPAGARHLPGGDWRRRG